MFACRSSGLFASPSAANSRFAALSDVIIDETRLDESLLGELKATSVPPRMLHALRVLLGTAAELEAPRRLASPASLATEDRVWTALMGYCKMARSAMGGSRKLDEQAARQARRNEADPRRALALEFRAVGAPPFILPLEFRAVGAPPCTTRMLGCPSLILPVAWVPASNATI